MTDVFLHWLSLDKQLETGRHAHSCQWPLSHGGRTHRKGRRRHPQRLCPPGPWVSSGAPGHLPKDGRQVPALPSTTWESSLSRWLWQLL